MHKNIALFALTTLCSLHTVHGMHMVARPNREERAIILSKALYEKPSRSFELICEFIAAHQEEISEVNPITGNTHLHEHVIEVRDPNKTGRFLIIAALLACGANREQPNKQNKTPVDLARESGDKAVLELLQVPTPNKRTLIDLVVKYELDELKPLLFEQ